MLSLVADHHGERAGVRVSVFPIAVGPAHSLTHSLSLARSLAHSGDIAGVKAVDSRWMICIPLQCWLESTRHCTDGTRIWCNEFVHALAVPTHRRATGPPLPPGASHQSRPVGALSIRGAASSMAMPFLVMIFFSAGRVVEEEGAGQSIFQTLARKR